MRIRILILLLLIITLMASCQSVKPYQRAYLNDRDFQFSTATVGSFEQKVHAYREGAAGAGKGISSGGCGCR